MLLFLVKVGMRIFWEGEVDVANAMDLIEDSGASIL
jgi:hypothetical protein